MSNVEKVQKRNGEIADFNPEKITIAVGKAFKAVLGEEHRAHALDIVRTVVDLIERRFGGTAFIPNVENIQDLVEKALMEKGFFSVAKAYIIYRYEHAKIRQQQREEAIKKVEEGGITVIKDDGTREAFDLAIVQKKLEAMAMGLTAVNVGAIVKQMQLEVYDGITTKQVARLATMIARSFIEQDSEYSLFAARLLHHELYKETLGVETQNEEEFLKLYREGFVRNIKRGVEIKKLDPRLLEFDLPALAQHLDRKRDELLDYLGAETLNDRYFIRDRAANVTLESPQYMWMRVAMGVALLEKDKNARAKEFYDVMSTLHFTPSTPTLFHAATLHPQLSSCYLNTVEDDLDHIFKVFGDNAQMSKWAGGIATDWSNLRGTGALIKKAGIKSQGVIPFLKIANDVTVAINRSGRRRGATCVYLEVWHYDFEDFLELRKNTGDERRRTHDMNTASWIPDLFMKRVRDDGEWTLFSPDEAPDLHHTYGRAFDEKYIAYEKMADEGKIELWKRMKARDIWKKMLAMLFETGHPWVTFKDPSNLRSPQDHVGVVHNSNLCTEITLNNSAEETAVCNLGSVNFAKHIKDGAFDGEKVGQTVRVGMRMLDNVIDLNFYPTKEGKASNLRHRPVGLGLMGFQDALYQLGITFDSEQCVDFADRSMEIVSYYAILASTELAKERGAYESFRGSKWDRGILPLDTLAVLEAERGEKIAVDRALRLDWNKVRVAIKEHGMRNSNSMAIAPTATISNIAGATPSIEPIYKNIYVKSNISGDFTVVNDCLVRDLKKLGLWGPDMLAKLKYHDGSVSGIYEIPEDLRAKYKEVFEIDMMWLIKAAAARGKWVDQSQSLNIFFRGSSGKQLSDIYLAAWSYGLKTTYYLRTMAASQVEKSTVNTSEFGSTHTRKKGDEGGGGDAPQTPSPIAPLPLESVAPAARVSPVTPAEVTPVPVSRPSVALREGGSAPHSDEVPAAAATSLPKGAPRLTVLPDALCESCQ